MSSRQSDVFNNNNNIYSSFNEFNQSHSECTLWPAVRDLLTNFTVPQEAPQAAAPPPS